MRFLLFSILFLFNSAFAVDVKISALPAATTPLSGAEVVPCVQSGVTDKCTSASIGAAASAGSITLAQQANLAASSIEGNISTSVATPQALNPLQVGIMGSYGLTAHLASTANVTLSGVQTIDGILQLVGQSILLKNQSTASQNGLWIVQSGAWTRPINFPSGFVLPANCTVDVFIESGVSNIGHSFALVTTNPITVDTTAQSWGNAAYAPGTTAVSGLVRVTNGSIVVSMQATPLANGGAAGDCGWFTDTAGSLGDIGDPNTGALGPCMIIEANSHPFLQDVGTTVTGAGCSLAAGTNTDTSGGIVATGIDTCTVVFGAAFTKHAPYCSVGNIGLTVNATLTALPTTAHAIFATAGAGTFNYTCF